MLSINFVPGLYERAPIYINNRTTDKKTNYRIIKMQYELFLKEKLAKYHYKNRITYNE